MKIIVSCVPIKTLNRKAENPHIEEADSRVRVRVGIEMLLLPTENNLLKNH